MKPLGFFDRRVRGFRVVEVGAAAFLLVLVLVVYLAKTGAGDKRADIDQVQQRIDDEQSQIRLLRAEVATLEQPERLEALSAQYLKLQPVTAKQEVTPEALADLARAGAALTPATAGAPAAGSTAVTNPRTPGARTFVLATATTTAGPMSAPAKVVDNGAPAAAASVSGKPKKARPASPSQPSLDAVIDAADHPPAGDLH